jgi:hypothetical protein
LTAITLPLARRVRSAHGVAEGVRTDLLGIDASGFRAALDHCPDGASAEASALLLPSSCAPIVGPEEWAALAEPASAAGQVGAEELLDLGLDGYHPVPSAFALPHVEGGTALLVAEDVAHVQGNHPSGRKVPLVGGNRRPGAGVHTWRRNRCHGNGRTMWRQVTKAG